MPRLGSRTFVITGAGQASIGSSIVTSLAKELPVQILFASSVDAFLDYKTRHAIIGWIHNTNRKVATSLVGRWFKLDGSGSVSWTAYPAFASKRGTMQCARNADVSRSI